MPKPSFHRVIEMCAHQGGDYTLTFVSTSVDGCPVYTCIAFGRAYVDIPARMLWLFIGMVYVVILDNDRMTMGYILIALLLAARSTNYYYTMYCTCPRNGS